MDPVTGLIFALGVIWAVRESGRAVSRSVGTRRAAHRKAATQRGGTRNQAGSRRRAARQATAGYWAGEARHLFPEARHGFAQGWREHQQALAQRETDTAAHRADTEGLIARLRAEKAAHEHRLATARQQASQPPTMSDQLRATPVRGAAGDQTGDPHPMGAPAAGCTNPDCSCHATVPPLADGKTPGTPPAANGHKPAAPSTNGGPVSDFNYDQTVETARQAKTYADHAVNMEGLEEAVQMADALGSMIPEDGETLGKAGELAAAVAKVKVANAEMMDAATALEDRVTSTYQNTQESVDASGVSAPEPEFMAH